MNDSPAAYWRLGEASGTNAADETSNALNGTYNGSLTLGQTGALTNSSNTCVSFPFSSSAYVSRAENAALKPATITIEQWGRPTTVSADNLASVMKTTNSAWNDGYGCYVNIDLGAPGFCCWVNDRFAGGVACAPHLKNVWMHWTMTYDLSNVKIYKNGLLVSTIPYTTAITHSTAQLEIGRGGGVQPWDGRLDEVAIYGSALSAARIKAHYDNSGRSISRNDVLVEGATYGYDNLSSSTNTIYHCVGGESNRLMLIGLAIRGTATVSSVTWGAQSLTSVGAQSQGSGATTVRTEMWSLVAPATGCDYATINWSAALTNKTFNVTTFSGVHQTTPLGTYSSTSGSSTAPSVSVSSASRELVIDVLATTGDASSVTQAASQTEWNFNNNSSTASGGSWGGASTKTGAASVTMSWTLGASKGWALGGVPVKSATTPTLIRMNQVTARQQSGGTLVQWQTGYEVDNLGFHVYREDDGQRSRVTRGLLAGSALLAGTVLTAGHSYRFFDARPRESRPAAYWIEEVDIRGESTWHGPVWPVPETASEPAGPLSKVISARGAGDSNAANRDSVAVEPRAPPPRLTPADLQRYWAIASRPGVKLGIAEEGWYRVGKQQLVAAGLAENADPRTLQLFVDGAEQAIQVPGAGDGRFDQQDFIEFYGLGLDTPWSGSRTYWLVQGDQPGKRISTADSSDGRPAGVSFPFAVERRERSLYFAALKNGDEDNFFGRVITHEPVEQALTVHHLDDHGPASLEVSLQGVTATNHQVQVLLNGAEVGTVRFSEQDKELTKVPLPGASLHEGINMVTLISVGGETDTSIVDFVRLSYAHRLVADNDAQAFVAQGGERVVMNGFSGPGLRTVDVTDPGSVREVSCDVIATGPDYTATTRVPGSGARRLLTFRESQIKLPRSIRPNTPSAWHEGSNEADIVIITHRDFRQSTESLVALRKKQGYAVAVVDVEDVYDELNAGDKSTEALQRFLLLAQQWKRPPRFVLLVGDASFDPRNYLGFGDFDFVPTKLLGIGAMESATDDWFADFDGDGVPEIAVGRLPVRTKQEADRMIARIVAYEESDRTAQWKALAVSGKNDDYDFESASNDIALTVPATLITSQIFSGKTERAKQELLSELGAGHRLVTYVGHGSVESWADDLLTRHDTPALEGSGENIFINLTCLNAFFQDVYTESLGEALVKAEHGGALAVWGSSNVTAWV